MATETLSDAVFFYFDTSFNEQQRVATKKAKDRGNFAPRNYFTLHNLSNPQNEKRTNVRVHITLFVFNLVQTVEYLYYPLPPFLL